MASALHLHATVAAASAPLSVSMAWGLAMHGAIHVVRNLVVLSGAASLPTQDPLTKACEFAAGLFFSDGPTYVRPTKLKSKPAPHLSMAALGAMCGLIAHRAPTEAWLRVLAQEGVSSNKLRGEWTGVSMARYEQLFQRALACHDDNGLLSDMCPIAVPLIAAYAWQRTRTQEDIDAFATAAAIQNKAFSPKSSSTDASQKFLKELALEAVQLDRRHWSRQPLETMKHEAFPGTAPVSDCVEVAIREILEYVATDPLVTRRTKVDNNSTGTDELPGLVFTPTLERLLQLSPFVRNENKRCPSPAEAPAGAAIAKEWFDVLHTITPAQGIDFLQRDSKGRPFELSPVPGTVSSACAFLLRGATAVPDRTFRCIRDIGFTVTVEERPSPPVPERPLNRSGGQLSLDMTIPSIQEVVPKTTITVQSPHREHQLVVELELKKAHPSAKVIYEAKHWAPVDVSRLTKKYENAAASSASSGAPWLFEAAFGNPLTTTFRATNKLADLSDGRIVCSILGTNWQVVPRTELIQQRTEHITAATNCLDIVTQRPQLHWLAPFVLERVPLDADVVAIHRAAKRVEGLAEMETVTSSGWTTRFSESRNFFTHPLSSMRLSFS